MQIYAAPLEGLTNTVWRQVHARLFPGAARYFTPFISPTQDHCFAPREWRELDPDANGGASVTPQLLTNRAADFIWAAGELRYHGYTRVDLNLGCPSGTVTAKGKGAGFLRDPAALDRFLGEIFSNTDIDISIKTRIGYREETEWERLLAVYCRYPLAELTVHPRLASDAYKGHPRMKAFHRALTQCSFPVCYNGDISTVQDAARLTAAYPVAALMCGRGLIADPALVRQLQGGASLTAEELRTYIEELYAAYRRFYIEPRAAVGRMKEHWYYLRRHFADSDRLYRQLCKADTPAAYEMAAAQLWQRCAFRPLADTWEVDR